MHCLERSNGQHEAPNAAEWRMLHSDAHRKALDGMKRKRAPTMSTMRRLDGSDGCVQ